LRPRMGTRVSTIPMVLGFALLLASCSGSSSPTAQGSPPAGSNPSFPAGSPSPSLVATQKPAPVESIPPGDLPDTVAWIHTPTQAGHFQLDVPEGWSRSHPTATSYLYEDNAMFNTIEVGWSSATRAPTVASVNSTVVPQLQVALQAFAFKLESVTPYTLKAGAAIQIKYLVNSPPNPTTGKQERDEVVRYEIYKNGIEAYFALSSTVNQDTTDFYNHVRDSFTWI